MIVSFVRELADYERADPRMVHFNLRNARRDGFGKNAKFQAVIAEWNHEPAGMALYFFYYSTWQARPGLYLEDLYVLPKFRGNGIGKKLLKHLAKTAKKKNCSGLRWEVLDWNKKAIRFYKRLGAHFREDWRLMQVDNGPLDKLAEE